MTQSAPRLNRARIVDGLILVAIVAVGLWVILGRSGNEVHGLVGSPAPAFKLRTLDGAVTGPPDHQGKIVLLDFWATWCEPCRQQMPIIQELLDERGDSLVVLPINVDNPGPRRHGLMLRFLEDTGLRVDTLIDDGAVQAMYRVGSIPALVLIDPAGNVAYASSGVHSGGEIRKRLAAIESEATK